MNPADQRVSCPGFLDEYGIWNNGFECPSLANQIRVCCGSDSGRYCCLLEQFNPPPEKSFLSSNEITSSFLKKINLTFLTLPIQLTCIVILILLFLLIFLISYICYRYHQRKSHSFEQEHLSTKETLFVDHFPFSPPHHQLFFKENTQQAKETLTTSTSSSLAPLPSDIYLNDWKEFYQPMEQSMNVYPQHGKYQSDEIIV